MRYLPLIGSLLFTFPTIGGAVQFSCLQGGTVTIWEVKTTKEGDVFCVKQKFQFTGVIALPDPQKGVIYTLKCEKEVRK